MTLAGKVAGKGVGYTGHAWYFQDMAVGETAVGQDGTDGMKYIVVYEKTPNNFSAYVPDLPGCVAAGGTREETERLIREAIAFHLEGLHETDEPIPEPSTWTETVEVSG